MEQIPITNEIVNSLDSSIKFLMKREHDLIEKVVQLRADEIELAHSIKSKKRFIADFDSKYSKKARDIEREIKVLDQKRSDLKKEISKLEEDQQILEKEQNAILNSVNKLESLKKDLEVKLKDRLNKVEAREEEVELRLREIRLTKEVKEDLKKLQQQRHKLYADVKSLESREKTLKESVEKLMSKSSEYDELVEMRENFQARSKQLNEREIILQKLQNDLKKEEEEIIKGSESRLLGSISDLKRKGAILGYGAQAMELMSYIEKASDLVKSNNIGQAKEIYTQVRSIYEKMPGSKEKEKIYFAAVELKNEIELKEIS